MKLTKNEREQKKKTQIELKNNPKHDPGMNKPAMRHTSASPTLKLTIEKQLTTDWRIVIIVERQRTLNRSKKTAK